MTNAWLKLARIQSPAPLWATAHFGVCLGVFSMASSKVKGWLPFQAPGTQHGIALLEARSASNWAVVELPVSGTLTSTNCFGSGWVRLLGTVTGLLWSYTSLQAHSFFTAVVAVARRRRCAAHCGS